MAIHVVQLGSPRLRGEGLRIGTVRRPPRGVAVKDRARLNYFDVWLPELAPSASLLGHYQKSLLTPKGWREFAERYRREMAQPAACGFWNCWQGSRTTPVSRWAALRRRAALPPLAAAGAVEKARRVAGLVARYISLATFP